MYSVYMFTVVDNGKSYIGYTGRTPKQRLDRHLTEAKHYNPERRTKWHRALIKYGKDKITICVLSTHETRDQAAVAERTEISSRNTIVSGYNTHEGGMGGRTRTTEQIEELRARMIERNPAQRKDVRSKIKKSLEIYRGSQAFTDWKKATREQRSKRMRGHLNWNYGKTFTAETRQRLSASQKRRAAEIPPDDRKCKVYLVTTPQGEKFTVLGQSGLYELLAKFGYKEWAFRKVVRGESISKGIASGWAIKIVAKSEIPDNYPPL